MSEPAGFRWCHAALILVGANAISALPAGFGGDFAFYNAFRQPAIAPPPCRPPQLGQPASG